MHGKEEDILKKEKKEVGEIEVECQMKNDQLKMFVSSRKLDEGR